MTLVPFHDLMAGAEREQLRGRLLRKLEPGTPVGRGRRGRGDALAGDPGLQRHLHPAPRTGRPRPLAPYAAMGLDVCRELSVPCCLLFNESPHLDWVFESIELGFNMTMFSDEEMGLAEQTDAVRQTVAQAAPGRGRGRGGDGLAAGHERRPEHADARRARHLTEPDRGREPSWSGPASTRWPSTSARCTCTAAGRCGSTWPVSRRLARRCRCRSCCTARPR